jgi:SAM-dependent methyltransferase
MPFSRPERDSAHQKPRVGSPSVLDLVRLSPRAAFPLGGEALYRQIALATGMKPGQTVLDAACGTGIAATFFAEHYGVEAHGLEADPRLVEDAEARVRGAGLQDQVHMQASPFDDLPYRDGIFDVAIGEVALAALSEPARAVRELARVTKTRGSVVLVELIWTGHLVRERRDSLVEHLGAQPLMLMEWKQLLRDAGVVDLHVEDWSDAPTPFRPMPSQALQGFADIFTLRQKIEIIRRALQRWGWRGMRGAMLREREVHDLLRQRVLGLSMIHGTKWE